MKKRIFSMLLTAALILGVISASVFAPLTAYAAPAPVTNTPYSQTSKAVQVGDKWYIDAFNGGERTMDDTHAFLDGVLSTPMNSPRYNSPMLPLYQYWTGVSGMAFADNAKLKTALTEWDNRGFAIRNSTTDGWRTDGTALRYANSIAAIKSDFNSTIFGTATPGTLTDEFNPSIENQPMLYTISRAVIKDSVEANARWAHLSYATIFYDFEMSYINTDEIAAGTLGNYSTPEEALAASVPGFTYNSGTSEKTFSTGVQNLSAIDATATQSFSLSATQGLENSVGSNISVGFSEMIGTETKISAQIPFLEMGVEATVRASFTASQTFDFSKSTSTSQSQTNSVTSSVGVTLPPHTEIILEQSKTENSMEIKYDCPVAITYKVMTVGLWGQPESGNPKTMTPIATFGRADVGHSNAVDNFYKRWNNQQIENAFGEGISWAASYYSLTGNNLPSFYYLSRYIGAGASQDHLNSAHAYYVMNYSRPMSLAGGVLSSTSEGFSSTINGIVPMYPLKKVTLNRPEAYNMAEGDILYVDNIGIGGYNSSNVPYFGFNVSNGEWKLLDDAGAEVPGGENSVAKLVKNNVSGITTLVAKGAGGTVYLKYFINETAYKHSTSTQFATNSSLTDCAVAQINVASPSQPGFDGSVELKGTLVGYVGEAPINLSTFDGIIANVLDNTGKAINAPITWEQKELTSQGISVSAAGELTFTKPGNFNIRAKYNDIASPWLEVTALEARKFSSLAISDVTMPKTLVTDIENGPASVNLSQLLVEAFDQYGASWADTTGLLWKCDDAKVSITGDSLTVSETGNYDIYAEIGGIKSNALTLVVIDTAVRISEFTALPNTLGASGGNSVVTMKGINLPSAVYIAAFDAGGAKISIPADVLMTGNENEKTGELTFPANYSINAKSFTVKYSLDGGINYLASPTISISQAAKDVNDDDPPPVDDDAKISVSKITAERGEDGKHKNIVITITLNGKTLDGLDNGGKTMEEGTDYIIDGNTITIKGEYLDTLLTGKYIITFNMSGGKDAELELTIKELEPDKWENPFVDVSEGDWFYSDVEYVVRKGLMLGTSSDRFSPDTIMTRAMLVTILYRLEGEPSHAGVNPFTDVLDNQWYTDAIIWAAENGVVHGYGGGLFGPEDMVTREQIARVFFNFAKFKGVMTTDISAVQLAYPDKDKISEWAIDAAKYCQYNGFIRGDTYGNFNPQNGTLRSEAAALLRRFVEAIEP